MFIAYLAAGLVAGSAAAVVTLMAGQSVSAGLSASVLAGNLGVSQHEWAGGGGTLGQARSVDQSRGRSEIEVQPQRSVGYADGTLGRELHENVR